MGEQVADGRARRPGGGLEVEGLLLDRHERGERHHGLGHRRDARLPVGGPGGVDDAVAGDDRGGRRWDGPRGERVERSGRRHDRTVPAGRRRPPTRGPRRRVVTIGDRADRARRREHRCAGPPELRVHRSLRVHVADRRARRRRGGGGAVDVPCGRARAGRVARRAGRQVARRRRDARRHRAAAVARRGAAHGAGARRSRRACCRSAGAWPRAASSCSRATTTSGGRSISPPACATRPSRTRSW